MIKFYNFYCNHYNIILICYGYEKDYASVYNEYWISYGSVWWKGGTGHTGYEVNWLLAGNSIVWWWQLLGWVQSSSRYLWWWWLRLLILGWSWHWRIWFDVSILHVRNKLTRNLYQCLTSLNGKHKIHAFYNIILKV